MIQFDTTKVGGLRWLRLGRLSVAVCVSREFRPFGMKAGTAAAVERIRARLRRREAFRAIAKAHALAFACGAAFGLPLLVGGVL